MTEPHEIECPLPSRLHLHPHPEVTAAIPVITRRPNMSGEIVERKKLPQQLLKVGALTLLAFTTIVVPLSGFVDASSSVMLPFKNLSTHTGATTWLASAEPEVEQASLEATVAAASRTRVRTPLLATACVPVGGADGTRHIVRQASVYWPMAPGTFDITSGFSWRISPISGQLLLHEGVDMAGPMGTPIYAIADGIVTEVNENDRSGAYIIIEHRDAAGEKYSSVYRHQYRDQIVVSSGDMVRAGQEIGHVGNNGWSTGPHLHFEILNAAGTAIDPVPFMENIGATYIGQECL